MVFGHMTCRSCSCRLVHFCHWFLLMCSASYNYKASWTLIFGIFAKAFVCFLNLVITGNILMSCWSFFILGILLDCSTLYTYGVTRAIQGFLEQSVVKFWVFLHFWLYVSFFVCAVLVLFLDGRDARSIHDNLVPIHAQPLNCMALTIPFCLG